MNGSRAVSAMVVTLVVLAGCTSDDDHSVGATPSATSPSPSLPTDTSPPPSTAHGPTASPTRAPVSYDVDNVLATVERLAGEIGPREGTSDAFRQAATEIGQTLSGYGYTISEVEVPVPAGNSWGVDVPAGNSVNVIADAPGLDPTRPHVVIGAHLDTVPQAPGAEDNASGVASMVELARVVASDPSAVPVRFIGFGAEEPRGQGDAMHHFGSQHYVAALEASQAAATVAMVSLDRVGVRGAALPICTGGTGTTDVRDSLVRAADTAGVPTDPCADNRASDHWSFEKADIPSARLGSVPFAGYHSGEDVPAVLDERQLGWVGDVMVTWLDSLG